MLLLTLFAVLPAYAKSITIAMLNNGKASQTIFAKEYRRGAQLAVAAINKRGGVLKSTLVLGGNSEGLHVLKVHKADKAAQNTIPEDFIIDLSSPSLLQAEAPAMLAAGKVIITANSSSASLVAQYPNNLFLTSFNDKIQAAAAAQYIMSQMHLARAFVLYEPDMAGADSLQHNFTKTYQHLKGDVVGSAALVQGKITPKLQAAISSVHPNVLYVILQTSQAAKVIKQLRDSSINMPIMASSTVSAEQLIPLGKSVADNIYYTTPGFFDANFMDDNMLKFVAAYRKKYNVKPSTIYSALGYDNVQLLAAAIKKARTTKPAKVAEAIKAMKNFKGVTGDLDMSQNPPTNIVTVVKILNAKARTAAMVIPQYLPS